MLMKKNINIIIAGITGDIGSNILEQTYLKYSDKYNLKIYGTFFKNRDKADELKKKYSDLEIDLIDFRNEESVSTFFNKFNNIEIDVAIDCIGVDLVKPFLDTDLDDFNKIITSNLNSAFLFSQYSLENMNRYKSRLLNSYLFYVGRKWCFL